MSQSTDPIDDEEIPDHIAERVAYDPTPAEVDAARDDALHTDHVTIEDDVALGAAHATVRERVEVIVAAAHANGVLQEVTITAAEGRHYSVSIDIDALENWNVEGQYGFDSAHVRLGVQGGLARGKVRSLMTDGRTYDSFDRLVDAIERLR